MNIKEAEKATGVSSRNIRFYEQKGLVTPARNVENDYREYSEEDIHRLKLIRALRMVDMPLEQIREVVDGKMALRQAATMQKEKLEDQIKHLKTVIKFCEELSETEMENVSEVLMRMDQPENKKTFSKKWRTDYAEKIKHLWYTIEPAVPTLAIVLIVAVMTFVRFCAIAIPTWVDYRWYYLPMVVNFIFGKAATTIFVLIITAGAVMLVPCNTEPQKTHRFLIRPLSAALVVLVLSGIAIPINDKVEDAIWDRKVTASHKQIQKFIQIADEAYAYSTTEYQDNHYQEAFSELVIEDRYVTDTMMIDYDTMTLAFCFHGVSNFELKTFQFVEGGQIPESSAWKHTLELANSGGILTMFFEYRDGMVGNGFTITCIALTMPDGTVYTIRDLIDPGTGYSYFFGNGIDGGYFKHIEGIPQRDQS